MKEKRLPSGKITEQLAGYWYEYTAKEGDMPSTKLGKQVPLLLDQIEYLHSHGCLDIIEE